MKHLIAFLVFLILILSVSAIMAQTDTTIKDTSFSKSNDFKIYSGSELAAKHLEKAGSLLALGVEIPLISGGVSAAIIYIGEMSQTSLLIGGGIGITGAIVGVICLINAGGNLKKASKFLSSPNEQFEWIPMGMSSTENGLGLVYQF